MVLSDSTIRSFIAGEKIGIKPYDEKLVQPASLDLTLGKHFRWGKAMQGEDCVLNVIDTRNPPKSTCNREVRFDWENERGEPINESGNIFFQIDPGQFVLACTVEHITLPSNIKAQVCGKSSWGRCGLFVENAGFIDPGFSGILTLELFNAKEWPIILYPGMRICQLEFQELDRPAENPYGSAKLGSHYQNQAGATESRFSI
jgi:dCTP deaminase